MSLKYCSMNFCCLGIEKRTEMMRTCNTVFLVSLVKKCPSKAFLQLWLHTDIFLCSKEHSRGFQIDLHFDKTHSDNALVVSKLRNLICTCLHNYHCICRQTICWLLTILYKQKLAKSAIDKYLIETVSSPGKDLYYTNLFAKNFVITALQKLQ